MNGIKATFWNELFSFFFQSKLKVKYNNNVILDNYYLILKFD